MKILFMGTPEFSVDCLKMLTEEGHEVAMVVTQPDKPRGRGHKLQAPPVKEFALSRHIPVEQPQTLKNEAFLETLRRVDPELIIVVAYGKILPPYMIHYPKYGCINVHASLLPKLRGAAPIQWSIIQGEKETGITTMRMDDGLDTGDMLLKFPIPIEPEDTYGTLHDKLKELGACALRHTLEKLEKGQLQPEKQQDSLSSYAPMIFKEDGRIDWSMDYQRLYDRIRGLTPFPSAYSYLGEKRVKFSEVSLGEPCKENWAGEVLRYDPKKGLAIAANGGILYVRELQFEKAKRTSVKDCLNGHKIAPGDRFE